MKRFTVFPKPFAIASLAIGLATALLPATIFAASPIKISVSITGGKANESSINPKISANGRYVLFDSMASNLVIDDTNEVYDVFVRDLVGGKTELVSLSSLGVQGNLDSFGSGISSNGRYVIFSSD